MWEPPLCREGAGPDLVLTTSAPREQCGVTVLARDGQMKPREAFEASS